MFANVCRIASVPQVGVASSRLRCTQEDRDRKRRLAYQQIVIFDVGGTPFRVTRPTIERYPDSLLAALVHKYADSVFRAEPIFVDRSPKAFEWILDIYRGGDFKRHLPDLDAEALDKELAFYKLPPTSKLGMNADGDAGYSSGNTTNPGSTLFQRILHQINGLGLEYIRPLNIWLYYKYSDNQIVGDIQILVKPDGVLEKMDTGEAHADFRVALERGFEMCNAVQSSTGYKIKPFESKVEFFLPKSSDGSIVALLNKEAEKYGMQFIEEDYVCDSKDADPVKYPYLKCVFVS